MHYSKKISELQIMLISHGLNGMSTGYTPQV